MKCEICKKEDLLTIYCKKKPFYICKKCEEKEDGYFVYVGEESEDKQGFNLHLVVAKKCPLKESLRAIDDYKNDFIFIFTGLFQNIEERLILAKKIGSKNE